MDISKEVEVKSYINKKEKKERNALRNFAECLGLTKIKEWLKNDKDLMNYAELTMKEHLSSGEAIRYKLLELKLSMPIFCPYFADFKTFLQELKRGPDTSTTTAIDVTTDTGTSTTEESNTTAATTTTPTETTPESSEIVTHTFCGIDINNIKSEPYEKSSRVGVTWCSKTARNNGKNFGIILPSEDPYKAGKNPGKDCLGTLPANKVNEKPNKKWNAIEYSDFVSGSKGNFADIYLQSESDYGLRAIAFKDDGGQWYVLDPYTRVNGKLDNSPKKLEDYLKNRKIIKAHFYESKGYVPESQEIAENPKVESAVQWAIGIAEDNCHGYEWGGKGKNGQYDCSGLVTNAFKQAGFNVPISGTATMRRDFTRAGFEWISPYSLSKLKRGDIVLKDIGADGKRHTEIYTGNGKFVGARSNKDARAGDSSGNEIAESSANWLKTFGWNGILRYKG